MIEQALRSHFKALDIPLLKRVRGLHAVPPKLLRKTTREHSAPLAKKLGTGSFMQVMTTADPGVVRKFGTDCYGLRGQLMLRRTFPRNPHFMQRVEYVGMFECDEHPPLFVADVERLERMPMEQYPNLCWWIYDGPSVLGLQRKTFESQKFEHDTPASMVEALEMMFWVAGRMGRTYLDLHTRNIMVRPGTGDLVFSDPFAYRDCEN